jgi:uncharacterized membrane protein YcaP (DUF421 family)
MDIVVRAAVVFAFLVFLTRVVGKRELSTMQPFDVILLVVLGDLVAQGVLQSDYSVTGVLLAAGTMAILTVLVSFLAYRVRFLRPVLDGEPVILLQDGKPIEPNMRRERITDAELAAEARMQSIESLADVKWAVLETNGRISFIQNR